MNDQSKKERPGNASRLSGMRVLFLPKNSRTGFFQSILRTARQDRGWHIQVVCPPGGERVWRQVIGPQGACIDIPNFNLTAAWERDAKAVAEIDAFITSCERASGVSVGRIILAGERDVGRGYSIPNVYWFHDRMARRVLADNTEPNRIVRRMFAFARETLAAARPDFLLAGEWADPLCFVFYLTARQMDIATVVNRKSKLWSGRCYWSADLAMYNGAAGTAVAAKKGRAAGVSQRARDRIAAFRDQPDTLGYVKSNWDMLDRRGWLGSHIEIARLLAAELRYYTGNRSGPQPKPALRLLWDIYRRMWLKFRQSRFFRSFGADELRDMRYILIALHKDPEQALNYQAFLWSNQYNTVSMLSGSLPDGYRLLVREHRNNTGRRPTQYYKDLSRLPGVVLVDGHDDQFKYIRNADLIVTDNGSTGWEGLMLGRRVITLTDTYYSAAGLAKRIHVHELLSSTALAMLQQPAVADAAEHDRALGCMLDAEWETSAPIESEGHAQALVLLNDLSARASHAPAEVTPLFA